MVDVDEDNYFDMQLEAILDKENVDVQVQNILSLFDERKRAFLKANEFPKLDSNKVDEEMKVERKDTAAEIAF